jgi:hypothetical protein
MTQLPTVSEIGEDEDDITMDFNFEVVEDLRAQVEALAYKSTHGCFKDAREPSNSVIEGRGRDEFPNVFKVLRLLYDQGQYRQLRKTVGTFRNRRPSLLSGSTTSAGAWSEQELEILELMDTLALSSMYCNKGHELHKLPPQIDTALRLGRLRLEALEDEDVS